MSAILTKLRAAAAPLLASPYRSIAVLVFLAIGAARWAGLLPGGTAASDMEGLWSVLMSVLEIVGG